MSNCFVWKQWLQIQYLSMHHFVTQWLPYLLRFHCTNAWHWGLANYMCVGNGVAVSSVTAAKTLTTYHHLNPMKTNGDAFYSFEIMSFFYIANKIIFIFYLSEKICGRPLTPFILFVKRYAHIVACEFHVMWYTYPIDSQVIRPYSFIDAMLHVNICWNPSPTKASQGIAAYQAVQCITALRYSSISSIQIHGLWQHHAYLPQLKIEQTEQN